MDRFLKEYDRYVFEDWGTVCSPDFKSFARKFKNYLKRSLPEGYKVVGHRCGHYDLSGFVENNGKYVYYSWYWNRGSQPIDLASPDMNNHVLYRRAENEKDYRGGGNHFCSVQDLPKEIAGMLS